MPIADEIFDINEYNTLPEPEPVKDAIKGALGEPHPTKLRYTVCAQTDNSESWFVFESPGSTPGEPVSLFDFYTN